MELLGRIFGRHTPVEEAPKPSPELIELLNRWKEQVSNRRNTETIVATRELLQVLASSPELLPWSSLKFVRDRDSVVMSLGGRAHEDIARDAGFQYVSDAGFIERDSNQQNILIVHDRSTSLDVSPNKKNRPETVKVLRKIAPGIKIEAKVSHGVYL